MLKVFLVECEYESAYSGPPPHVRKIAITVDMRQGGVKNPDEAAAWCMAFYGKDVNGKSITRIHHKDEDSGEFYSIIRAKPLMDVPVIAGELPTVRGLAGNPKKG